MSRNASSKRSCNRPGPERSATARFSSLKLRKQSASAQMSAAPKPFVKRLKKTPNAEHRTSNVESSGNGVRAAEVPIRRYAARSYDLEERLLEFAANIVEFVESLPN